MSITFPDMSESPWTHPDTGIIYEYADGMWRPQDPSGGGGSGSGGGPLDLESGLIIGKWQYTSSTTGPGWVSMGGNTNMNTEDLNGFDTSKFNWAYGSTSGTAYCPVFSIITDPNDERILAYSLYRHITLNKYSNHTLGAKVENNYLYHVYDPPITITTLSDEALLNIIASYNLDPSKYQPLLPRVNVA